MIDSELVDVVVVVDVIVGGAVVEVVVETVVGIFVVNIVGGKVVKN